MTSYLLKDRPNFIRYRKKWITENRDSWLAARKKIEDINRLPLPDNCALEKADYTIFDLETTGFTAPLGDEIISIGALKFESNPLETYYSLVQSCKPVSPLVSSLTGLTEAETSKGAPFPEMLPQFLDFTQNRVLVAHPASFDVPFMEIMCRKWLLPEVKLPVLDSFQLAELLFPGKDNSLDGFLRRFHMPVIERHHALNDAKITAEIFSILLKEAAATKYKSLYSLIRETDAVARKRRRI
jgi:DNA polymerase III subunit epsilon